MVVLAVVLTMAMLATPIMVWSVKSRHLIAFVVYDINYNEADYEEKVLNGITFRTRHYTASLWAFGPRVVDPSGFPGGGAKLVPVVTEDGADMWVTEKFDPATGFGSFTVRGTWNFGEAYGSFDIHGSGDVAGILYNVLSPGPPPVVQRIPAWYSQGNYYGNGKGALMGTQLKLDGSYNMDLPDFAGGLLWPDDGTEAGAGFFMAGEVTY
jgi:hypothetical protein